MDEKEEEEQALTPPEQQVGGPSPDKLSVLELCRREFNEHTHDALPRNCFLNTFHPIAALSAIMHSC